MTAGTGVDWIPYAAKLADDLTAEGKLVDPRLAEGVRAVPRHHFVPTYYRQDERGWWIEQAGASDLAVVYSDSVLITALGPAGSAVLSSSSRPGLTTRMIEALGLDGGVRVLEIGTGTGYNAALLSHLFGAGNTFSVDVEPDLVDLARERLAVLGHRPLLTTRNGTDGLPEHAPFDAILATCAVPAIPWAWVQQVRLGGVILTELKPAPGSGSLVRLTRIADDRAQGRFDATHAAFVDLRNSAGATPDRVRVERDHTRAERRGTDVSPTTPWTSLPVWFLAGFQLGSEIAYGYTGTETCVGSIDAPPTASWIATRDGSWAEVGLAADAGRHTVVEGGPRRLWRLVEQAHATWTALGRPGWDRFGLTVTRHGQYVWLDQPDSDHVWRVAGR